MHFKFFGKLQKQIKCVLLLKSVFSFFTRQDSEQVSLIFFCSSARAEQTRRVEWIESYSLTRYLDLAIQVSTSCQCSLVWVYRSGSIQQQSDGQPDRQTDTAVCREQTRSTNKRREGFGPRGFTTWVREREKNALLCCWLTVLRRRSWPTRFGLMISVLSTKFICVQTA